MTAPAASSRTSASQPPASPDATIVVPSIASDPLLVHCVSTCRRLYPGVEIIALIDEGGGADAIEDLATVVVTGPMTIGAKRNRGVELSSTDYVAFIDSDAYPEPGWLERATDHLDADQDLRLGAVGGPNVSPSEAPLGQRCVGQAHLSPLVCAWWTYRKQRWAAARDVTHLPTCNLVVRRADYKAVGGMDEQLFTAEDTDFCRRLTTLGRQTRFEPDVIVVHKDRNLRDFMTQRYTFGVAMVPLLASGNRPSRTYTAASLLPVAALAHFGAGPMVLRSSRLRRWWLAVTASYGLIVGFEACRTSSKFGEAPGTALALVIGNLGPGVGLLVRSLGGSSDLSGVYRNDRS